MGTNYVSLDTYYAQIMHSMPYMNLHMARLGADDLTLTTSPTHRKITGHQLSELIELAQNREDWRQLVVTGRVC